MVEERQRRQAPWWVPIVAVGISAVMLLLSTCGLVLGPVFGATVAVAGVYVTNQTRSAVTETKLEIISGDVKQIKDTLEKKNGSDGETKMAISNYGERIGNLEARATKQENQYSEILGRLGQK
jgi:hypothetical protein